MALPSLLSDHEQRAFSDFLTQLNHDEQNHASRMNNGSAALHGGSQPPIDPSLSQAQIQHHLYLRHLQQQQQQQQQQHSSATPDNGPGGVYGGPFPITGSSLALAPSLEQQQREWIQHLSSNPLLAPGGVIDPHAMSQAFLQNPQLMAQANAISQAMMIAQHQQQMLQHQQQQQQHQRDQEQRHQHHQHYQISDGPHDRQQQQQHQQHHQQQQQQQHQPHQQHQQNHQQQSSYHASAKVPSQFPGQDQHPSPPQEYLPHPHRPQAPSLSSSNLNLTRSGPKEKSNSQSGYANDPTSTSPLTGHNNNSGHGQLNDAVPHQFNRTFDNDYDNDSEPSPPPSKKAARLKGSTAASSPYDSPKAKSTHRSSRDGHDPSRVTGSRKSSSASSFPAQTGGMNGYKHESMDEPGFLNHQHLRQNSAGQNSDDEGGEQDERSSSPQTKAQGGASKSSSKKAPHELLTDAEKKANHIASEQKRRQNIRVGFDCLVEIVPTLSECHRSEALILQKSVDYIHRLLSQKNELESKVRYLQTNLGEPNEELQFLDQSDYSDAEMNHSPAAN